MVYSTRQFVVCLSVCHFVLVFFSPFSIAITSLEEERANLSASHMFVLYVCSICARLVLLVSSTCWRLERAAICDCGTSLSFLLLFSIYAVCCVSLFVPHVSFFLVPLEVCASWLWHFLGIFIHIFPR